LGFRVQGLGFRVQGLGFRVQGLGFRIQGLRFRVWDSGFRGAPLPCAVAPAMHAAIPSPVAMSTLYPTHSHLGTARSSEFRV
jgi:hypothetical protein